MFSRVFGGLYAWGTGGMEHTTGEKISFLFIKLFETMSLL